MYIEGLKTYILTNFISIGREHVLRGKRRDPTQSYDKTHIPTEKSKKEHDKSYVYQVYFYLY